MESKNLLICNKAGTQQECSECKFSAIFESSEEKVADKLTCLAKLENAELVSADDVHKKVQELELALAEKNKRVEAQADKIHNFFLGRFFKLDEFCVNTGMSQDQAMKHIVLIESFGMIEKRMEPLTHDIMYKIRKDTEFRVASIEERNFNLLATIGENKIIINQLLLAENENKDISETPEDIG